MAKRVSLRERRAEDARGIDSIFQGSPPAETRESQSEPPGADQESTIPVSQQETTGKSRRGVDGAPDSEVKPPLAKVTVYVRPDQVLAVESIQLAQRKITGRKPDKSDLMQEALDLLIEKYSET